jgi:hypothetical protein
MLKILITILLAASLAAPLSAADTQAVPAAKKSVRTTKKSLDVVLPEEKPAPPKPSPISDQAASSSLFEEIEFGGALVIEGKVEKPQVQFTLLKEPPPEKEIRFETSFLQNILKQERENTFNATERYGRD